MGDVVDFPGKKAMENDEGTVVPVVETLPDKEMLKKVIIGETEFYVDSVELPKLKFVEWEVHTLQGPTRTHGPRYWSPLGIVGPEELGNLIQGSFPLPRLALEFLDPETEVVEEWWEFHKVYLSTQSEGNKFLILFENATKRN